MKGHRFNECHKTLNMAKIAANKADYFLKKGETKGNREKSGKRVLYELVTGLNELFSLDNEHEQNPTAVDAYFGDIIDSETLSEEDSIEYNPISTSANLNFNTVAEDVSRAENTSDEDF